MIVAEYFPLYFREFSPIRVAFFSVVTATGLITFRRGDGPTFRSPVDAVTSPGFFVSRVEERSVWTIGGGKQTRAMMGILNPVERQSVYCGAGFKAHGSSLKSGGFSKADASSGQVLGPL